MARKREHHHSPFGSDRFGQLAERFARFFGTPGFIIAQTVIVVVWIAGNAFIFINGFDPFPFILLNLCFSTQAAYAAPLILLAQTRQADRDKAMEESANEHRELISADHKALLEQNTTITKSIHDLTSDVKRMLEKQGCR
jgi:uncharacterized membrane protein